MTLLPPAFLVRVTYPVPHFAAMPGPDRIVDLPEAARLDPRGRLKSDPNAPAFAEVRVGWNALGLGFQFLIKGKSKPMFGRADNLRGSDGVTLWIDTRDTRTIHRASRYCHQITVAAAVGQNEKPKAGSTRINRSVAEAEAPDVSGVPLDRVAIPGGYSLEIFIPGAVLTGYDPETNPRLGFYYLVHDQELGNQSLGLSAEFPYWEDPSLWSTLELHPD